MSNFLQVYADEKEFKDFAIQSYKTIFKPYNKPNYMKTEQEYIKEVLNAGGGINFDMETALKNTKEILHETMTFSKRTELIPILLESCYLYYCHKMNVPFNELPKTPFKFTLLIASLERSKTNDEINNLFVKLISDSFIKELRNEDVPYHLTAEIPEAEIMAEIEKRKDTIKQLLNALLKYNSDEITSEYV